MNSLDIKMGTDGRWHWFNTSGDYYRAARVITHARNKRGFTTRHGGRRWLRSHHNNVEAKRRQAERLAELERMPPRDPREARGSAVRS